MGDTDVPMLTKPAALDGGYMEGDIKSFTDTATKLSRSPLGIIALFVVLVYGIAALAPALYASSLGDAEKLLLVIFIVAFPVIILGVFAWLVTAHNDKVYAPTEFLTLEDYLKFLEARSKLDAEKAAKTAASLSIATLKSSAGGQELQGSDIDQIVDVAVQAALPSVMKEDTDWHDHILWVDDRPQANAHERRAFEAMGIRFSRVTNTQEALELLHRQGLSGKRWI
ncbi:hypothetical protein NIIDNTM18_32150 [Mycolicibacterium litorale]|uniref:Uncharacterized protein n=1 Tax=Mycolicibacterium litorale TaxID=758802 RepID=A0A6S6P8W8_9MYCO|nr:hypothetical protein [Mycolicibacterium litorale]BCI53937.1 hypothetical protein NIIDNTM18_32150 [Mycolicibacterium litorale]